MNATQTPVTITGGGYTAEVHPRGGQLLSLTSGEDELIVPASTAGGGFPGAVLAPWPNRIAGASYVHDETTFTLPVTEEETGAAIHGFLHGADLAVVGSAEDSVHLSGVIGPVEGYPYPLEVSLIYRVAAAFGLAATLSVRYVPEDDGGDAAEEDAFEAANRAPAPFGAGFHPYLTAGAAKLDECRLRLPARTMLMTKADGEVVGRKKVKGDYDLTGGPLLAGRTIDHTYTGLPQEWSAELIHGPSGFVVRMIGDAPWVQVYTGEAIGRAGVAVEPMTCPPNAFNTGEDVVYLAPGQWHRTGFTIEAIRND